MNEINHAEAMLQQLNIPAFLVSDGRITAVNAMAKQRMIEPETAVNTLLVTGHSEYAQLKSGCLYLTISLAGIPHRCTVTVLQNLHLFAVETETVSPELQSLSLAAAQLSIPLSDLGLLFKMAEGISGDAKTKINHTLHRLQRIVGNMADAGAIVTRQPRLEQCNATALFQEILENSGHLLTQSGFQIKFSLPNESVSMAADAELLRRGLLNLLSNAAKFAAPNSILDVTVKKVGQIVYLSVSNSKNRAGSILSGNLFHRYSREPGLEDPKIGLGLGMTLIHAMATAHGGTVLVEDNDKSGTRITVTLHIRKQTETALRSPIIRPDIYGGHNQALIELSDVLAPHLYEDIE